MPGQPCWNPKLKTPLKTTSPSAEPCWNHAAKRKDLEIIGHDSDLRGPQLARSFSSRSSPGAAEGREGSPLLAPPRRARRHLQARAPCLQRVCERFGAQASPELHSLGAEEPSGLQVLKDLKKLKAFSCKVSHRTLRCRCCRACWHAASLAQPGTHYAEGCWEGKGLALWVSAWLLPQSSMRCSPLLGSSLSSSTRASARWPCHVTWLRLSGATPKSMAAQRSALESNSRPL